jgi:uncharacterized protein
MDPQLLNFLLLALFIFLAHIIGAATGFGASIVALTFAVHLYPIDFLIPVIVPLNMVLGSFLVLQHGANIDRKILFGRILPLAGLGMPLGLLIFYRVDSGNLKLVFGILVLIVASVELMRALRNKAATAPQPLSAGESAFWLVLGGIIHGLYSSGGPMIVYYASRRLYNKTDFRSTLSALWLILSIMLFISHLSTGNISPETAWFTVRLLPVIIVGIVVGEKLHDRLAENSFRILVFAILVFAGASIVVKGLL